MSQAKTNSRWLWVAGWVVNHARVTFGVRVLIQTAETIVVQVSRKMMPVERTIITIAGTDVLQRPAINASMTIVQMRLTALLVRIAPAERYLDRLVFTVKDCQVTDVQRKYLRVRIRRYKPMKERRQVPDKEILPPPVFMDTFGSC
jgi:hypothetical protein